MSLIGHGERPHTRAHREPQRTGQDVARAEIDAFLNQVKALGPAGVAGQRGRLIFALDATMSRQPLWDTACQLQADMFNESGRDRRARRATGLFPRPGGVPGVALGIRCAAGLGR